MSSIGQLAGKIFDLLKDNDKEDTKRVLDAVSLLCGTTNFPNRSEENSPPQAPPSDDINKNSSSNTNEGSSNLDATKYISNKNPSSKTEMLAVAARFSELKYMNDSLTSNDFSSIFSEARQNFDSKNFSQDMKNAKKKGLFVKGSVKSAKHKLSYNGQNFVDALPDRVEAKKCLRTLTRKKTAKKRANKKESK